MEEIQEEKNGKMHRTVLRTIGKTSKMEERQGKELQDASYSP